jgi:hypothetical protein
VWQIHELGLTQFNNAYIGLDSGTVNGDLGNPLNPFLYRVCDVWHAIQDQNDAGRGSDFLMFNATYT